MIKTDIAKEKASPNIFIPADKTTNTYELSRRECKSLLKEKITKTYKKGTPRLEDAINLEAKQIAKSIKLDNKIECTAKNPALKTLKYRKINF